MAINEPLNVTEIKTRHGLIMQGLVREALRFAEFTFRENWQYSGDCERPDFTIPDCDTPLCAIEVHQTDARSSFRMKILRALNAVTEAKVYFGDSICSVNVLFGDPERELPASNVQALFGFFDVNIVPRSMSQDSALIVQLEDLALQLASNPEQDVAAAIRYLIDSQAQNIAELSRVIGGCIRSACTNTELNTLWQSESERVATLPPSPSDGAVTHYKRSILQSLFLSDDHWAQLAAHQDPNRCSEVVQDQLLRTRLATIKLSIRGDLVVINPTLTQFLSDSDAPRLRALCEDRLDSDRTMHWFFSDIRDAGRRTQMANAFIECFSNGSLEENLLINLMSDHVFGIEHARAWLVDCCVIAAGISQHALTRRLFSSYENPGDFADPASHITLKTDRFKALSAEQVAVHAHNILDVIISNGPVPQERLEPSWLSDRLLDMRVDAAIKLQKLNPLYLVVESVACEIGTDIDYRLHQSFLSDLSGTSDPVGKNYIYEVRHEAHSVLVNALYVGDTYGSDHKADEWSARRRSLGYRIRGGSIEPVSRSGYVFVLDGVWSSKSIQKLHSAGWDYICRLPDLEQTLRDIFCL